MAKKKTPPPRLKKKKKKKKKARGRPRLYNKQEPTHESHALPELEQRGHDLFWPHDYPIPVHASIVSKTPCPKCRRLSGVFGQASLRMQVSKGLIYFRCRYCKHQWILPKSS